MKQSLGIYGYALNTVAASGADIAVSGGLVSFTGVNTEFVLNDIFQSVVVQAYVAPVARVSTLTTSAPAAVGEAYTVNFRQPLAGGGVATPTITVLSITGSTANTMAAALNTAINGFIDAALLEGTSTVASAVVTTTGATTAPMLEITSVSSNVALVVSTAGNPVINSGTQLSANYPNITNLVTTNNYTTVSFAYKYQGDAINNESGTNQFIYAVNEGDADYSAFVTKANQIFGGIIPGGTAANPENISLLG